MLGVSRPGLPYGALSPAKSSSKLPSKSGTTSPPAITPLALEKLGGPAKHPRRFDKTPFSRRWLEGEPGTVFVLYGSARLRRAGSYAHARRTIRCFRRITILPLVLGLCFGLARVPS
jgi:hypothetical protein